MCKKNSYELIDTPNSNYDLDCDYGQPGELGNPPDGKMITKEFTEYSEFDKNGLVAHTPKPNYQLQ